MKLPPGYVAGQGVVKATAHGGFGERMLETMGWSRGDGLGKSRSGIKQAIEVKKKEDTVGIGGNASYQWDDKWWERAFDSAVQTIDTNDSDSSDSDTDDEARQPSAKETSQNRDGTRTTASVDELKLLKQLSKGGKLAAGRFSGRDGKMARIRAQEAKEAAEAASKLGIDSSIGAPSRSDRSDTTSDAHLQSKSKSNNKKSKEDGATAKSKSKKKKSSKSKPKTAEQDQSSSSSDEDEEDTKQPTKKQRIVIEPKYTATHITPSFEPTPSRGWWGASMFISAGALGSTNEATARGRGFTEDDQARIYNNAQLHKTQGRLGMGQSTRTLAVGGVKWAGNKVSFEEEEDKVDQEEGDVALTKKEEKKRKKLKEKLKTAGSCTGLTDLATTNDIEDNNDKDNDEDWVGRIKWKKLITQTIKTAPNGCVKLKTLKSEVGEVVLSKLSQQGHSDDVSLKIVKSVVGKHVESSSKFVLDGKLVKLK